MSHHVNEAVYDNCELLHKLKETSTFRCDVNYTKFSYCIIGTLTNDIIITSRKLSISSHVINKKKLITKKGTSL